MNATPAAARNAETRRICNRNATRSDWRPIGLVLMVRPRRAR